MGKTTDPVPVSPETRKCGQCTAAMVATAIEETRFNRRVHFVCPHCSNEVLIDAAGMAGFKTAIYACLGFGYLIGMNVYAAHFNAGGIALFSILGVFTLWVAVLAYAPQNHFPVLRPPDAARFAPSRFNFLDRLKYEPFGAGVSFGLAVCGLVVAGILAYGFLIGL